jgi:hypothetical protein
VVARFLAHRGSGFADSSPRPGIRAVRMVLTIEMARSMLARAFAAGIPAGWVTPEYFDSRLFGRMSPS